MDSRYFTLRGGITMYLFSVIEQNVRSMPTVWVTHLLRSCTLIGYLYIKCKNKTRSGDFPCLTPTRDRNETAFQYTYSSCIKLLSYCLSSWITSPLTGGRRQKMSTELISWFISQLTFLLLYDLSMSGTFVKLVKLLAKLITLYKGLASSREMVIMNMSAGVNKLTRSSNKWYTVAFYTDT